MRHALKVLAWMFLALIAIYLILFAYGRLRGPTPEQEQAIKLLTAQPKFDPATNAEAYFWLLEYDVPLDQEVAITARDIARYNALTDAQAIMDFKSEAEDKFPRLEMNPDGLESFCREDSEQTCLQRVSAQREKVKKILADNANALRKAERIRDYRSHYSSFKTHMIGPYPAFHHGHALLKTHYADLYLDGKRVEAMDKMCRDLQSWRSISANSDMLITNMIGQAYSRQRMRWLAEMLGQLPPEESIPASCNEALTPVTADERSVCHAMQGEHEIVDNLLASLTMVPAEETRTQAMTRHALPLLYSNKLTSRGLAPARAAPCLDEVKQKAAKDLVHASNEMIAEYDCDVAEWAANPMGCWFDQETPNAYIPYQSRRLDFGAQIEAARIVLWLRQQNSQGLELKERFAQRPADMRQFEKRVRLLEENGKSWIVVDQHEQTHAGKEKQWRLPVNNETKASAP